MRESVKLEAALIAWRLRLYDLRWVSMHTYYDAVDRHNLYVRAQLADEASTKGPNRHE